MSRISTLRATRSLTGLEDEHVTAQTELVDGSLLVSNTRGWQQDGLAADVQLVVAVTKLGVCISTPSEELSAGGQHHDGVLGGLEVGNSVVVHL